MANTALTPLQAAQLISTCVARQPAEAQPLARCIGRVLRQDVYAERDNPPFDRVCMDGVAIASTAFEHGARGFNLQATQAAGAVPLQLRTPADAIEVMTGAVLPAGTDCVIPLEEYELAGRNLALKSEATATPWRNVQRRGSDSQPGIPMLRSGLRLEAADVAVLASAGLAQAQVGREQRIVVISTGDELVEPGAPIADHQIRRSNAYGVEAALHAHGFEFVTKDHLPDEEAVMRRRLGAHLEANDVLVLSGGVSKGKFDFVPSTLKSLGVEERFYQVAQRPGRPLWFGIGPKGQAVFGLPGNPVSTLICLRRFVLPALQSAMGLADAPIERVALAETLEGRSMTYFMPVVLRQDDSARTMATSILPNGSGDFLALSGTHGFVELPPDKAGYPQGFIADLYRW